MTEADVFAAILDLVQRGEYRDEIPGVAGARLEGGGWSRDGRRLYARGSPEYLSARAAGLTDRLPPLSPAPPEAVERAEAVIGARLPPLLRRLYLQVGNGGFGPAYGVLGVDGGHPDDYKRTAVDLFADPDGHGYWQGPTGAVLLPICHWGCAIYSLVDCASDDGRMWAWDPNPTPPDEIEHALFPEEITIADWLARWVDLRLNQPCVVQDPESGQWRGATDAEWALWTAEMDA